MISRVTVRAPATSANLGSGFDCLGVALSLGANIHVELQDGGPAPRNAVEAMVTSAVRRVYQETGNVPPRSLAVTWDDGIPLGRGLGASAALRAAGLLAANAFLGDQLDGDTLLRLGAELEGHADNIAPALLGGLQVIVATDDGFVHIPAPMPDGVRAVLFVPDFEMPTNESRRLLPRDIPRRDAIHNIGRAALLVAAFATGRLDVLDVATQDRLHQRARSQLFPAMYPIFGAAKEAGALAAYLSGGGSTILALASGHEDQIARAMQDTARQRDVNGKTLVCDLSERGAEMLP
jgi:homoserine kinase